MNIFLRTYQDELEIANVLSLTSDKGLVLSLYNANKEKIDSSEEFLKPRFEKKLKHGKDRRNTGNTEHNRG